MDEVDALLTAVRQSLSDMLLIQLRAPYGSSPPPGFHVLVKNVLENMRSTLDYAGREITERYGERGRFRYYPLADTRELFGEVMERNMPGVAMSQPSVRDAIERHQPYNSPWLAQLNKLTNTYKHNFFPTKTVRPSGLIERVEESGTLLAYQPEVSSRIGPLPTGAVERPHLDWHWGGTNVSVRGALLLFEHRLRQALSDILHEADR